MALTRLHDHPAGSCRHCGKAIVLTDTPQTGPYHWHRATRQINCEPLPGYGYSTTRAEP